MKRFRLFCAAIAASSFIAISPVSAEMPEKKGGMMEHDMMGKGMMGEMKGRHQMMQDLLGMMKEMMGIIKEMNHTPTPEQKNRLDEMMKRLDGMMEKHEEMMMQKKGKNKKE